MKITEQTSTRLKLEDQNRQWLYGVLFGFPFVAVGLAISVTTANVTTLACQRTEPTQITCQRTIAGLLGTQTTSIPEVRGAGVIKAQGTGVVLSTAQGQVELVNHPMRVGEEQQQLVRQINAFVQTPQQAKLTIQQDDRWEGVLAGSAFFLPGVAVMLAALTIPMRVSCCFDKTVGQFTLEKQHRLVYRRQLVQHQLVKVQKAEVVQFSQSSRNPVYFVQLEVASVRPITLSPPTRDRQQCQTVVDSINQFCKLAER